MQVLFRLVRYAWRYRGRLLLAYFCLLGATLLSLAVPRLLGIAIDTSLASGSRERLIFLALAIVGVSLVRGVFAYGQSYLSEYVSQRVAYDLRNAFYDHLQRLSFAYHDRQQTGNLMSRATADVEGIRWFVSMGLVRSAFLVILVVGVAYLLLSMDWKLGLMSLAFVPLVALRATAISRRLREIWLKVQTETGHMTTVLQESLSGIRVVKAFAGEEHEEEKFREKAGEVSRQTYLAGRLQASNSSLMTLVFTAATGLILWYGGRQVVAGQLTAGELAQFIMYIGILAWPVRMTGWLVNTFTRAVSSGERIFQVLDATSPVEERQGAVDMLRVRGNVRFEGVSFSYDSRVPALRNVDFQVNSGQVVALLGAPGSGKSTLAHLVPRFYDVSQGRITIDGTDIRDMTLASLRRNVGIVLQDVFIFTATIRENLTYGRVDASMDEVVAAAKLAQLHDFISALPEGYETQVGERGVTLSGGQRQRLAIARTLLLNPPILILDDSTSSVDVETEHLIRRALANVVKGRTTFVIAHRLSTVQNADLILVLQDGEIVQRGAHRELVEQGGPYREIYELQLRPQEEALLRTPAGGDNGGG